MLVVLFSLIRRHKAYDRLPGELKQRFPECQVETSAHEGYSMAMLKGIEKSSR